MKRLRAKSAIAQRPSSSPAAVPAIASSRLSASSSRTSRAAPRAQRRAHRHLALAHRAAHQQQVRDVHARDQQHESGQRRASTARASGIRRSMKRIGSGRATGFRNDARRDALLLRIGPLEPRRETTSSRRLRRGDVDARTKPSGQTAGPASSDRVKRRPLDLLAPADEAERHVPFDGEPVIETVEALRRDADHARRHTIDANDRADHRRDRRRSGAARTGS